MGALVREDDAVLVRLRAQRGDESQARASDAVRADVLLRQEPEARLIVALELVDPSGRIDARVWHDVELLDSRFAEGDAVRVLGRVEKFRDRLQLDVRTLEAAPGADPATLSPTLRRDADELDGFLEFLAREIAHAGLAGVV